MGLLRIALPLLLLAFALAAQSSLDRIQSLAGAWELTLTTFPATLVTRLYANGDQLHLRSYCYAGNR